MIHSDYYLDSIEAVFEFIEKNYKSCLEYVDGLHIYSVTVSVKYNEYGAPILIDTIWRHERGLCGLDGPTVSIKFSKLN